MGFKCGIVGLPNVGKSTLFNALTESNNAEAANYPFATIEPNIGRVPVPDKRLLELNKISKSIKMIPTFIDFVDIAGLVKGASKGEGLGNKFLSHVKEVDAIAHVVRCFDDENITHVSSSINPEDDIDIIETELILADLQTLENKINAISKQIKGGDKKYKEEAELIKKIQDKLNNNESIKNMDIPDELKDFTNSLNLISNKPMLFIRNVDEKSIINGNKYSRNC
jgi:GTP-binding protein YchF